jgi:AmiR/NasT family two-component response regulator
MGSQDPEQAEGLVNREHVEQLKEALGTSRLIGAAIGIVMANRRVDERGAFEVLRKASSHGNRKLRLVAEDVVLTGAVDELPAV